MTFSDGSQVELERPHNDFSVTAKASAGQCAPLMVRMVPFCRYECPVNKIVFREHKVPTTKHKIANSQNSFFKGPEYLQRT